jgi:GNAT superfamily N-acetyltransferase
MSLPWGGSASRFGYRGGVAPVQWRPAVAGDIAACIVLRGQTRENSVSAARLAEAGITEASWAQQVNSGELLGVVAQCEGRLVGYCFGASTTGEVVVLALLPAFEGRGLGKALLQWVMRALRACGHQRLFLGCADDPAVRSWGFYRHLGWRTTGSRDAHGDEVLEHETV